MIHPVPSTASTGGRLRVYGTTVPAAELAQRLADRFRAQEFGAQVFRAGGDRTVMQSKLFEIEGRAALAMAS